MTHPIRLMVNGAPVERRVEPRMTLADFLRESLDLTGTHLGCEHGVCGACTVLVDGRSVRGCLMYAVQADGASVVTVEGLAERCPVMGTAVARGEATLSVLQQAFHEHHALQCGFCTPGLLTTAFALLAETPDPSPDEVRLAISGNLCRCTGYVPIVEAILDAARQLRAGKAG
ncbi:MAG: (2Fe-2S)-binding protein [Burkholderiales bacterium]|nr:(2Fe-2S)-binding protein [Burkholderiales bacterium]